MKFLIDESFLTKSRMKQILLLISCFLFVLLLKAQSGTVSGKIIDSATKKALQLTTITIFDVKDTSIITYRLSMENGVFRVPGIPIKKPLRLIATYSGYAPFKKEFVLDQPNQEMNLGNISLNTSTLSLDEVVVTAERPPVIIKNDTIEFSAAAFKTLPTALLEDLLKKLPGLEVDESGNITANGRKVNRLLIDGKQFFGNDPKMATRNLPSNIVDKVQVIDDKEELALNNDGDVSRIGKIINIRLKKEIKKAVFGKLGAGKGTEGTYEVNGIVNSFKDTLQLSVLGFSNNVNKSSFSLRDVGTLGGFDRSGYNGIAMYGGGGKEGFKINGVPFGGTGVGISTVNGGGFNLNHSPSKNFSFYFQEFYGETKNKIIQTQNIKRFNSDTTYTTDYYTNNNTFGSSNSISAGTTWKVDSMTNLRFTSTYNISKTNSQTPSQTYIQSNFQGDLSRANSLTTYDDNTNTYSHNLSLTHSFPSKKGRQLSFYHSYSNSSSPSSNLLVASNTFIYPVYSKITDNQLRFTNNPNKSLSFNLSYSEPLSKIITMRLNERISYEKSDKTIISKVVPNGSNSYDSIILSLSNGMLREQTRMYHSLTMSLRFKKLSLNLSPTYLDQRIGNYFTFTPGSNQFKKYQNFLLNANINWEQSGLVFSQDINAPYLPFLSPVPDNSNPLLIVSGNPGLEPTKRNELYYYVNHYNLKRNLNYSYSFIHDFYENYIVQSVTLSNNGVQTTKPLNTDGARTSYFNFRVNKQFRKKLKRITTLEFGTNITINQIPVIFNGISSFSHTQSISPNLRFAVNWNDIVEYNFRYAPNFYNTQYTNSSYSNNSVTTQNFQSELIIRAPKKLVWETNVTYQAYSSIASGYPGVNINWNAAVTLLVFKEDKGQIKFGIYDILNRNTNFLYAVTANSVVNTNTNILKRYAMLTFSYNIRSMGNNKQKVGGKQSMFLF